MASILHLAQSPVPEQETALASDSHAALRLWGARSGDTLTAADPQQGWWRVRLTDVGPSPHAVPFARFGGEVESRVAIDVYQALPDKERFELVLQKLTELGVVRIVPMETARSTTLAARDAGQAKSHRWPEVVRRAAVQCRRAMLPELFPVVPFAEALELAGAAELRLMLYEGEDLCSLGDALGARRPQRVALMVGPEGGFTGVEVALARTAGFLPVNLGPRILRTETAAIVGATLLQGLLGDLCRG